MRFLENDAGGTRVELEHRGFEKLGADGETIRAAVGGPEGWSMLLERYGEAAR